MTGNHDLDVLFEILLDDDAKGLTLIQGAAIHSCDDLRRARAELTRVDRSRLSDPARPSR